MAKLQRIHIGMVTSLDDETCRMIGMEHWSHDQISAHLGDQRREESIAFIPNASLTVKRIQAP